MNHHGIEFVLLFYEPCAIYYEGTRFNKYKTIQFSLRICICNSQILCYQMTALNSWNVAIKETVKVITIQPSSSPETPINALSYN